MKNSRINNLLHRYINQLQLRGIKIIPRIDDFRDFEAGLDFDRTTGYWYINLSSEADEYYIAHELSHISYAKVMHFSPFALPIPDNIEMEPSIFILSNMLLDFFVDNHLSTKLANRELITLKLIGYLARLEISRKAVESEKNFFKLLSWYMYWYLASIYYLKILANDRVNTDISQLLKYTKFAMNNFYKNLNSYHFQILETNIWTFLEIKDTNSAEIVKEFIIKVLKDTELWDPYFLQNEIDKFFLVE